jgi:hypothetical protein
MRLLIAAGLVGLALACQSAPPTPAPTLARADPADSVRALLPVGGSACYGADPSALFQRAKGCPVTARLESRLRSDDTRGSNPVCRCQSADPMTFAPAAVSGSTATVTVNVSARTSYTLVFTLAADGDRWVVDDITCGGNAATSIYLTPIRSCA